MPDISAIVSVFAASVAVVCVYRIERAVDDVRDEAERCRNAALEFSSVVRRMRNDVQYDLNAHARDITHSVHQISNSLNSHATSVANMVHQAMRGR